MLVRGGGFIFFKLATEKTKRKKKKQKNFSEVWGGTDRNKLQKLFKNLPFSIALKKK